MEVDKCQRVHKDPRCRHQHHVYEKKATPQSDGQFPDNAVAPFQHPELLQYASDELTSKSRIKFQEDDEEAREDEHMDGSSVDFDRMEGARAKLEREWLRGGEG